MSRKVIENLPNDEICNRYLNGEGINNLRYEYRSSYKRIKELLLSNGINIRGNSEAKRNRIPYDNTTFEKIDTEQKAYWLGFIYADGNLYKNSLQIALADKDRAHLESFKSFLRSEHKLYNDRGYPKLIIRCKKLFRDLENLGLTVRKSFTKKFPTEEQVPRHLINHFIRGYFDGDGCITYYYKEDKSFESGGYFHWSMSFLGTIEFLIKIQDQFISNGCSLTKIAHNKRSQGKNIWILTWGGGNSQTTLPIIYNLLYKDSTIYLDRKRDKFIHLMNYYNIPFKDE